MAVAIVRSASNSAAGSRSISVSMGGTPTNGNLLVFALGYYTGVDPVSTPAGWTLQGLNDPSFAGLAVFTKVASGESSTLTFTNILAGSDDLSAAIYEISGQAATGFVNQYGATNSSSAGSITTASLTPSVASCLALAFASPDETAAAGAQAVTVSSGWTKDHAPWPDYHGLVAAHRNSLTSDTITPITNTFGAFSATTGPKVASALLIAPATGGGGPAAGGGFFQIF